MFFDLHLRRDHLRDRAQIGDRVFDEDAPDRLVTFVAPVRVEIGDVTLRELVARARWTTTMQRGRVAGADGIDPVDTKPDGLLFFRLDLFFDDFVSARIIWNFVRPRKNSDRRVGGRRLQHILGLAEQVRGDTAALLADHRLHRDLDRLLHRA